MIFTYVYTVCLHHISLLVASRSDLSDTDCRPVLVWGLYTSAFSSWRPPCTVCHTDSIRTTPTTHHSLNEIKVASSFDFILVLLIIKPLFRSSIIVLYCSSVNLILMQQQLIESLMEENDYWLIHESYKNIRCQYNLIHYTECCRRDIHVNKNIFVL